MRAGESEGEIATVVVPLHAEKQSGWQFGRWFFLSGFGVEQMYYAEAIFICSEGDGLAVRRDVEVFHVPVNMFGEKRVFLRREVQIGEALEFGVYVRGDVDSLPVFAEFGAGVGDFFRATFRSEQCFFAGRRIREP